jgi:starvation-inducible DNA-binding protein
MEIDTGIPETARKEIAGGLARVLADNYTLYLKTHNYHWNVTGPQFAALHALFMTEYEALYAQVDEIAERIRALGFPAPGSYKAFSKLSSIAEEEAVPAWEQMVRNLVDGHEVLARTAREVFPLADKAEDEASCDLLTQIMRASEKTAWMLRSQLPTRRGGASRKAASARRKRRSAPRG